MIKRIQTPNDMAAYANLATAKARYQLGRASIIKLAKAAGARVTIGKCVRYNLALMDEYLDRQQAQEHTTT